MIKTAKALRAPTVAATVPPTLPRIAFSPQLPPARVAALRGLAMGGYKKVFLAWPAVWWPADWPPFLALCGDAMARDLDVGTRRPRGSPRFVTVENYFAVSSYVCL